MAQQQIGGGGQELLGDVTSRPPLALAPPPPPPPVYPITHQAIKQHKDHPLRMKLEGDEVYRAEEIKQTIQRTDGLDNISDFWCVQYSFICKDIQGKVMMEDVIQRAQAMQEFRNRYRIVESYEEGRRALRRAAALCPNYTLAFTYNPQKGNYAIVRNLANFSAENFSPDDERDFMVGLYFTLLSCYPDFQSIHMGPDFVVECKDMGWSKRHNIKLYHKAACDWLRFLPGDVCTTELYNTGVGGAVFNSMLKPMIDILTEPLSKQWHARKKIHFGLTYLEGLDSVFLVPDAATAQERALQEMEQSLRLRFQNQGRFSLSDLPWEAISPFTDDEVDVLDQARQV